MAFPLPSCVTALCEKFSAVAFYCVSDQHTQTFPWAVLFLGHLWSTNKTSHLLNSAHRILLSWWGSCEEQYFEAILCAINSFLQVLVNESCGVLVVTQKLSHIITQFIDIWCLIYRWFFKTKKDVLKKQGNVYSKSLDRNLAFLTLKVFFKLFIYTFSDWSCMNNSCIQKW